MGDSDFVVGITFDQYVDEPTVHSLFMGVVLILHKTGDKRQLKNCGYPLILVGAQHGEQ